MTDILEKLELIIDLQEKEQPFIDDDSTAKEAAAEIRRLREDIANRPIGWEEMVAEIYDLREQVQALKEALEFYVDPYEYCLAECLDERTPDFYDEYDTGRRAREALAKLGGDDAD